MKNILFALAVLMAPITSFGVTEVTESDLKQIAESTIPVVVEAYATWCGPCKKAAPLVEEAEKKLKGKVRFVKIDIDKSPMLKDKVKEIPTFVFVKNKSIVATVTGAPPSSDAVVALCNKVFSLDKDK
jgi:thioredoxin 1